MMPAPARRNATGPGPAPKGDDSKLVSRDRGDWCSLAGDGVVFISTVFSLILSDICGDPAEPGMVEIAARSFDAELANQASSSDWLYNIRVATEAVRTYSLESYGKRFESLCSELQHVVLSRLEDGDIAPGGEVHAVLLSTMTRHATEAYFEASPAEMLN